MDRSNEIRCLCLSESTILLIELFEKSKDGLTVFDKISCLSELSNILSENAELVFKFCTSCCDTIKMIYRFNITSLHNVNIFLSRKEILVTKTESDELSSRLKSIDAQNCTSTILGEFCEIKMGIKEKIIDVSFKNKCAKNLPLQKTTNQKTGSKHISDSLSKENYQIESCNKPTEKSLNPKGTQKLIRKPTVR